MNNVITQFFEHRHLPEHLQVIVKPFYDLAHQIDESYPKNAETSTALRKLLEAKDCAVRAYLFKESIPELDDLFPKTTEECKYGH